MRGAGVIAVLVLAAGCGSDPGAPPTDGAVDAGTTDGASSVITPALPMPAMPPALRPCAEGWREIPGADDAPDACDPWPDTGRAACGAAEAHFAGSPGCQRVGSECPAGAWPDDLPTDGTVRYVDATAMPGGDGTRGAPFQTVAAGLAAAGRDDTVVIARGTYREVVTVFAGVTLRGVCALETTISASSPSVMSPTVAVRGLGSIIRDLRITGPRPGIAVPTGATGTRLDGVVVDGARTAGILLAGNGPSELHDVLVRDTAQLPDGTFGRGIELSAGAQVTADRIAVVRAFEAGIFAAGAGASFDAERVSISETRAAALDGTLGVGVQAQRGASVTLSACAIEENVTAGAQALGPGSSVSLSDCVTRDVQQGPDGSDGRGIYANGGASVTLERVLVERVLNAGVHVGDSGSILAARDLWVRDVSSNALAPVGRGIGVFDGAAATLERARIDRTIGSGIAAEMASTLDATDVVVSEVALAESAPTSGTGAQFYSESGGSLTRVRLEHAHSAALIVSGSTVTATDLVIQDTLAATGGALGRGAHIQAAGTLTATRMLVERSREAAVSVVQAGTTVTLTDVIIRDTLVRDCATTSCTDITAGLGLFLIESGRATLARFSIERAALAGAYFAMGAQLDLRDGTIRECPVGISLQIPGYDLARLSPGVVFIDNGRNVDTSFLPVPDVGSPL